MPKVAPEMNALAVSRLSAPGLHFVGGVPGLILAVAPSGGRNWLLRVMVAGKRREIGLGGFPAVPLAMARERAREAKGKIWAGVDPLEEKAARCRAVIDARAMAVTFSDAAGHFIKAQEPGWRNAKHAQQWRNTLETYAYPVIGKSLVRDVNLTQVMAILEPIWREKTETASRVRSRIELVLDWATARGYRDGLNPARWRGHLDKLLARPTKVKRTAHHTALPIDKVPGFMTELRKQGGIAARAMEFLVLTAARSGEVRGATWAEIDLDSRLWVIPASRMKAEREHRVPLSDAAMALLAALPGGSGDRLVFQSPRGGTLSDMTLTAVLRRMTVDAVPHGFRSTFRDWCAERTHFPSEVAEMALAHAVGDKVEAAYRRGDLFEKRRLLMAEWAAFCARSGAAGDVIPIKKRIRKAAA